MERTFLLLLFLPAFIAANKNSLGIEEKEEELRHAVVESVKRTILDKLHMKHPPNITKPDRESMETLLQKYKSKFQFHEQYAGAETEDYYGKTENVFVFANSVTQCGSSREKICVRIPVKKINEIVIDSAVLYVPYKLIIDNNGDNAHGVPVLYDVTGKHRKFQQEEVANEDIKYLLFSITQQIKHEVFNNSTHDYITFKVACQRCDMAELLTQLKTNKPYLDLQVPKHGQRIKRRINQCYQSTSNNDLCCRQQFYVSFREIGWDSWIISPIGYNANYCTGPCEEPAYAYQHLSRRIQVPKTRPSKSYCCMPTEKSSISMLYTDNEGHVRNMEVKDMVVESCGCE